MNLPIDFRYDPLSDRKRILLAQFSACGRKTQGAFAGKEHISLEQRGRLDSDMKQHNTLRNAKTLTTSENDPSVNSMWCHHLKNVRFTKALGLLRIRKDMWCPNGFL